MTDLRNLIGVYKQTDWNLLLRGNMGDYHLKELKPHLDFIKNFFDEIIDNPYFESSYQPYEALLQESFNHFNGVKTNIEQYRDGGQKQHIINQVINCKLNIFQNLNPLFNMLKIQAEYHPDRCTDHPEKVVGKYSKAAKDIEQELKKLQQIQSQYAEQAIRAEASRYGDFFKKEAENNKKLSLFYGIVLLLFFVSACVFAYCFLKFDQNITANSTFDLVIKGNLINKIFIFTIIILLISILKREYLALKHQYTLNRHRHNALSSHKEILSSIQKTASGSDKEISNAILLELTKAMFSPQDTGFVKDQKDTSSENRIVEISKSFFNTSKE